MWVAIPFKWGQVFQRLDIEALLERFRKVAIPFKWGQVFQLLWARKRAYRNFKKSQSLLNEVKYSNVWEINKLLNYYTVAIPFKWGQVFQHINFRYRCRLPIQSQSLLNEVKYSNFFISQEMTARWAVAIPFKWGQVFQQGCVIILRSLWLRRNPF